MSYCFRVALHDTDAAGVVFFGHLFRHLHDAYEAWMNALGYPIDDLIRAGEIALPIVHAEADYRRPMRHGESIEISITLVALQPGGFTLGYRCLNPAGQLAAQGRTLHRCIDPRQERGRSMPDDLYIALQAHLAEKTKNA